VSTVPVSALIAGLVPGASARFFSPVITCWRLAFNDGVRASVVVPASTAGLISGRDSLSSWVAGASCVPSVFRSARNGRWTFNDCVDTCSVDGDSAIVCSRLCGLWEIAANVVAISVNSRALVPATGATAPMNRSSPSNNRVNSVDGAARYSATGRR
jgi:hypothetical protein